MSEIDLSSTSITNKVEAPFNSAIDCLIRISRILQKIERVSVEYILYSDISAFRLNAGQAQHIKARLVKQLFVQSIPLMTPNSKIIISNEIKKIKLSVKKSFDRTGTCGSSVELFDQTVDEKLDDLVIMIEEDLQRSNFFMPPRKQPGAAVAQAHN